MGSEGVASGVGVGLGVGSAMVPTLLKSDHQHTLTCYFEKNAKIAYTYDFNAV